MGVYEFFALFLRNITHTCRDLKWSIELPVHIPPGIWVIIAKRRKGNDPDHIECGLGNRPLTELLGDRLKQVVPLGKTGKKRFFHSRILPFVWLEEGYWARISMPSI